MDTWAADEHEQRNCDPGRAPLPPGDTVSWSLLVAGTVLEGLPWPGWGALGWDSPTLGGSTLGSRE